MTQTASVRRRGAALLLASALIATLVIGVSEVGRADPSEGAGAVMLDVERRITVGALHTCALLDTGAVQCWGSNEFGQLGNGTRATTTVPRLVVGITTATAIAAGANHTCALIHDGTVRCWGSNGSGQLGDGSTTDALAPIAVLGLDDAVSISTGAFHSCAVRAGGSVVCWGHDGAGQLGDGGTLGTALQPVTVTGITAANPAVAVTGGEFFSCALLADGTVQCWGHNGFGQLGDGTTTSTSTPVAVSGITDTEPATAIVAGYGHVCATRFDDTVSCWGGNNFGQLGDDTQTDRSTPVAVQDLGGLVTAAPTAIAAGQFHSCALLADGSVRCWGENGRSQLGNPLASEQFEKKPVEVLGVAGVDGLTSGGFHNCVIVGSGMRCWGYNFYGQLGTYLAEQHTPTIVTAVQGASTTTAGNGHACAIVELAKPECWGRNSDGQLGAVTPEPHSTTPVDVVGLPAVVQLSAGNLHTCALPSGSGTPQCWGRNADGQLGDGTNTSSTPPVVVASLTTATSVSAQGALGTDERGHTCARRSDATAACWGRNANGQLGDGTTGDRTAPVTVLEDQDPDPDVTLTAATEVVAGGFHSCAIVGGGQVRCWGLNGNGQLGDDTHTQRTEAVAVVQEPQPDPTPDVLLSGASQLALGAFHSCALVSGQVSCWGRNASGQLGDGTTTARDTATLTAPLPGGRTAVAITAGDFHTCALANDNFVFCWGENGDGQLGDGTTGDRHVPTQVPALDPPPGDSITVALSGGRTHTCAALVDTTVRCWGDNAFGQIGDGVGPESTAPLAVLGLAAGLNGNAIPAPVDDAATTADGVAVTIDVLFNDSDPDGDALTIVGVDDPAKGSAVTGPGGVTYSPDGNFCTVDPVDRTDTFAYRVSDGTATVPAAVTVTVTCPNDPPDAVDDAAATAEDTAVTITVLANDNDPNGDPITLDAVADPPAGTATIASGQVSYTPDTNACGADAFTYTISDNGAATDTASVTVTVACENDPPAATDDAVSVDEDASVVVDVLANDTDPDGDTTTVMSATSPAHGTTTVNGGASVTYTPDPGFCGTDGFSYTVGDGTLTDVGAVTATVACLNDGPNAVDDSSTTAEDTPVVIDVLVNDTDPDGDPLTIVSVTTPSDGTATIVGNGVEYAPDTDFCGADTFGYTVQDPTGETDSAVVVPVTVICHQDPPAATDDTATTDEDTAVVIDVLANDTDPDAEPLEVASVSAPSNGTATIASSGDVHYTPGPNVCGTDGFAYGVTDNQGGSDTAHVTVHVTCVNDGPMIDPVADLTTPWGDEAAAILTASDVEGDPVTFDVIEGPTGATVSAAGQFSWTPTASQVGVHAVTVRATDPDGASTQTSFDVVVQHRGTAVAFTGVTSGQYSDPVALETTLTDSGDGTPIAGQAVVFRIGSRTVSATTDAAGVAAASLVLSESIEPDEVVTWFTGDDAYGASIATEPFVIEPEAIDVAHTGTFLTVVTDGPAPVRLAARVAEENDGALGSGIATLQATFRLASGETLCTAPVTETGPGTGSAVCWSTQGQPIGAQAVVVDVTGANYAGPVAVGVFTVAQQAKGTAIGAGQVTDPAGGGGSEAFGFQAAPVRRSPPSGNAVHVFEDVADLGSGPRDYAFVVRSDGLSALSLTCTGGKVKTCDATVEAGSTSTLAVDVLTGAVMPFVGDATLRIDATDGSTTSGATDRYAAAITGALAHEVGTPAAQVELDAGDVRVTP